MFGFVQKIILTIITLGISVLFFFGSYELFIVQSHIYSTEDLLVILISVFGSLSFVFHLKTAMFYKSKNLKALNFKRNRVFWILNIIFILVLGVMSIMFVYQFSRIFDNAGSAVKEPLLFYLVFTLIPIGVGVWLFFDIRFLYKAKKKLEAKTKLDAIDNIIGVRED